MVGSMRSSDSTAAGGNNSGLGGPNSNNSGNSSSSSKGSNSSGGGLNSAGNRASGAGPSSSSNRSTTGGGFGSSSSSKSSGGQVGGGLNSAGNRTSGAGPGASSNRSTTGGGFGGTSNSMGGGSGGLNSAGNRASGAGPGASSNTSTTGGGFGSGSSFGGQNSPRGVGSSLSGGMVSDAARRADMAQAARESENSSMSTFNAARSLSDANAQRADMAQQARTSETQSMGNMATWGQEVKSVVAAGPGWTTVALNNGTVVTRKGDRASRNNNPGNIEAGAFAKKAGAVGTDGRFAVFASTEDGIKAISSLLSTAKYANETVEGAIGVYAPPSENNTANYAATVAGKIGVSKDTPMSSLTSAQRTAMAKAITGVEGNTGFAVTKTVGTDRFAATFMGGKTSTASTVDSRTATTQEAAKAQQNDPSGLPAGTYPGHVVGNGIAPTFAGPTKQANAAPTPSPTPAPAPTPAPERPRSITEKVAAGAIDVGLGMLPGVGTAVSVVNGGLALTGNKTLGERIAGSIATGENAGAGPYSGGDRLGGGNNRQVVDESKSTVPKKTESFEERYLAFVDPTSRPKPSERWNYDTAGYA